MADTCLLIVRPGHTLRDMLEQTIREVNSNGIKGASLVINASSTTNKHYGYGEKYGYTKDKKPGRKLISPGKLLKS